MGNDTLLNERTLMISQYFVQWVFANMLSSIILYPIAFLAFCHLKISWYFVLLCPERLLFKQLMFSDFFFLSMFKASTHEKNNKNRFFYWQIININILCIYLFCDFACMLFLFPLEDVSQIWRRNFGIEKLQIKD